jgi:TraC protein
MAARSFWDSFLTLLFGDAAHPEAQRPLLGAPMLSNWLPYRSFDAKARMFINTESVGFILELAPMMGADERSGEILTQFLSDAVPSGCEIQLIHWQSPSIGERIADWVMPRGNAPRALAAPRGLDVDLEGRAFLRALAPGDPERGCLAPEPDRRGHARHRARQSDGHMPGALDPGARHGTR